MFDLFQLSSGSVAGRDHVRSGKNNQDAHCILNEPDSLVLVVCDGCSDAEHSEVGSRLGCRLIAHTISRLARRQLSASENYPLGLVQEDFWERVRQDVLAQIRVLSLQMGDSLSEVVSSHFLFTAIGALITREISIFFSLGDGVLIVNGEQFRLGPYPDNEPPYLGYGLVETTKSFDPETIRFRTERVLHTSELRSFLIGTDGIGELIDSPEKKVPGREEVVGTVDEFWEADRFFKNRSALQRRLNQLNSEVRIPDWEGRRISREPGLLHDDSTLIVGRRRLREE